MADVTTKAINGNSVTAGRAVVGVLPNGNKQTLNPSVVPTIPNLEEIDARYSERLNDRGYYEQS